MHSDVTAGNSGNGVVGGVIGSTRRARPTAGARSAVGHPRQRPPLPDAGARCRSAVEPPRRCGSAVPDRRRCRPRRAGSRPRRMVGHQLRLRALVRGTAWGPSAAASTPAGHGSRRGCGLCDPSSRSAARPGVLGTLRGDHGMGERSDLRRGRARPRPRMATVPARFPPGLRRPRPGLPAPLHGVVPALRRRVPARPPTGQTPADE